MKTLSIIGIVTSAIAFLCLVSFEYSDTEAAVGWGIIAAGYLLALSITVLVKNK